MCFNFCKSELLVSIKPFSAVLQIKVNLKCLKYDRKTVLQFWKAGRGATHSHLPRNWVEINGWSSWLPQKKYLVLLIAFPFQSYCAHRQDQKTHRLQNHKHNRIWHLRNLKYFPFRGNRVIQISNKTNCHPMNISGFNWI